MNQAKIPQPPGRASSSATLEACRDMALKLLSDSLDGYFAELEEKFFTLAESTPDRDLRDVYFAARVEIKLKKGEIVNAFRQQFIEAFNQRLKGEQSSSGFFQVVVGPGELSLVANDDYEESLTASHVANTLKQKGGDTLSQLEQRLAALLPKSEDGTPGNLLSPEMICQAFLGACRHLDSGLSARLVALKSFESALSDRVASVYQSVNQYLIQQNVQPVAPRGIVRRPPSAGGAGGGMAQGMPPQQGDAGVGAGYPQGFGGGMPGVGAVGGGYVGGPAQGGGYTISADLANHFMRLAAGEAEGRGTSLRPEWFSFLDNLQHDPPGATRHGGDRPENLLALLRSTRWAGELNRIDTMTFDLVSMLFDRLFEDPHLANVAKGLLARLQIPVLKVALLDTDFFAKKQHPARRVVDLLEHAFQDREGEPSANDPEMAMFHDAVSWIVDHFEDDLGAFDIALGKIESYYADLEAGAEARTQDAAQDLILHEVRELSTTTAGALVDQRLERDPDAPELVRSFLSDWWRGALAAVYGPEGEQGADFAKYTRVMDELLWSLRPKRTPEERLQLVNMLPPMLKVLEQGAKRAEMPLDASRAFFAQLVQCHAMAIRSGLRAAATEAASAASTAQEPMAPRPQVVAAGAIVVARAQPAQPDVAPEPVAETVVPAAAVVLPTTPAQVRERHVLERGDWITWENDDNRSVRLRLSWVSPQGTRYLFTNRQGENGLTVTRAELEKHIESGRLRVLANEDSATERAFNQLREQLGA
ncbi:DUF1631 family protein [Chitiniphilus eburneus]|uniref:DUF1631 domain-containing protein n=1 Tax=Chitiniphilus eburneus TaxID=2571148 RepID=A0A4U0Q5S6_9NEIS|nr:DUF1631 family protein [Chitiniphilus eburneus]TJZ76130.1 DUF1631 domain-containing protein [Chitiniphilus eburneus]